MVATVLGVVVGIVVLLILTEHIMAWRDYRAALDFPSAKQAEVVITNYKTSQATKLTKAQVQDLLNALRDQSAFAGIGSQKGGLITPEDHAYNVCISSGDYYQIFIVAENARCNRLYGDFFVVKLPKMPEVVTLLHGYFT